MFECNFYGQAESESVENMTSFSYISNPFWKSVRQIQYISERSLLPASYNYV